MNQFSGFGGQAPSSGGGASGNPFGQGSQSNQQANQTPQFRGFSSSSGSLQNLFQQSQTQPTISTFSNQQQQFRNKPRQPMHQHQRQQSPQHQMSQQNKGYQQYQGGPQQSYQQRPRPMMQDQQFQHQPRSSFRGRGIREFTPRAQRGGQTRPYSQPHYQKEVPAFLQQTRPRSQTPTHFRPRQFQDQSQSSQRKPPPAFLQGSQKYQQQRPSKPRQFMNQQQNQQPHATSQIQSQQDADMSMLHSPMAVKASSQPQTQQQHQKMPPKSFQKKDFGKKEPQEQKGKAKQAQEEDETEYQEDDYYNDEYYDDEDYDIEYGEEETKEESSGLDKIQKVCIYFLKDLCNRGDKCKYLHDENQKKIYKDQLNLKAQYQSTYKGHEKQDIKVIEKPKSEETDLTESELSQIQVFQNKIAEQNKDVVPSQLQKIQPQISQSIAKQIKPKQKGPEEEKHLIPQTLTLSGKKKSLDMRKRSSGSIKLSQQQPQLPPLDPQSVKEFRTKIFEEIEHFQQNVQKYGQLQKAKLLQMCSQEEIHQRGEVEVNAANNFELDRQGQNFNQLAIKAYQRSGADRIMNNPDNIRHPRILYLTMKYLEDCIVDQDRIPPGQSDYKYLQKDKEVHDYLDIYNFVRDRCRAMAQDFIIIDDPANTNQIKVLEESSIFLICAFHDGYNQPSFEAQLNMRMLTENLSRLVQSYQSIKLADEADKQIGLRRQAEFLSYLIIASSADHFKLQEDIQSFDYLDNDDEGKSLLNQAISIHNAIVTNDCFMFFHLLSKVHYLFQCLMTYFLNTMRLELIDALSRSFHKLSYRFIKRKLLISSDKEVKQFLIACGFTDLSESEVNFKIRLPKDQYSNSAKKWRQKGSFKILDQKKGDYLRCDYMAKGVLLFDKEYGIKQKQLAQEKKDKELQLHREQQVKTDLELKLEQERKEKERREQMLQQEEEERRNKQIAEKIEVLKNIQEKQNNVLSSRRNVEKQIESIKDQKRDRKKKLKDQVTKQRMMKHWKKLSITNKQYAEAFFQQFKKVSSDSQIKQLHDYQKQAPIYQEVRELLDASPILPSRQQSQITSIQDVDMLLEFQFTQWMKYFLKDMQGQFTINLLSSDLNINRIDSDPSYKQYVEFLSSTISMLTNHTKNIFSPSNNEMKITYNTQLNDNINYVLQYRPLKKKENISIMGSSLLMYITNEQDLYQDLNILKNQLAQVPEWSQINFMFLVHSNQTKSYDEIVSDVVKELYYNLQTETISQYQIAVINLHQSVNELNRFKSDTLETIIFNQVQDRLSLCIKEGILIEKEEAKYYNMREIFEYYVGNLHQILKVVYDVQDPDQFDSTVKEVLGKRHPSITDLENEMHVLNFWLQALKQLIEPMTEILEYSFKKYFIEQTKDRNQLRVDQKAINQCINFLARLLRNIFIDFPHYYNQGFKYYHVSYCIMSQIGNLMTKEDEIKIREKLSKFLKGQDLHHFHPYNRFYKGTTLFMIILDYILEHLRNNEDKLKLPLYGLDLKFKENLQFDRIDFNQIIETLQDETQKYEVDYYQALKKQFPSDFQIPQIIPSYLYSQAKPVNIISDSATLNLTIKNFHQELNQKRDQRIASIDQNLQFTQDLADFNQNAMERLNDMLLEKGYNLNEESMFSGKKRTYQQMLENNEMKNFDINDLNFEQYLAEEGNYKRIRLDSLDYSDIMTRSSDSKDKKDYAQLVYDLLNAEEIV